MTIKNPIRVALAAMLGVAAITLASTTSVSAWGPERATFTNANPADYVTFNSITNNAAIGDERNFVRVGEANVSTPYSDTLAIEPGKEYEVSIYYHNNAASNLNSSGRGIANGVKVSSAYPTVVRRGERGMVSGIISATDANPASVWDEAYFTTDYDEVVLRYKPGTAIIHNGGRVNGSVLADALFTEAGTYIGINTLDGRIPGCAEYSGYITYTLTAELTASNLDKQVSTDGENWSGSVTAKPGDYVTYKVTFKNTGNTTLTNAIFKDTHDQGLNIRSGSTVVYDVNRINGETIDDVLDISGYNMGDIAPGALVQIIYQAQVVRDNPPCGRSLNNNIFVTYNSASSPVQQSTATVTVVCDDEQNEACANNPSLPGCVQQTCETNPDLPMCQETCETNPNLPGCSTPENCDTNPNLPGCELPQEIVSTGPLEIILACVVVLGIAGAGFYLYRTRRVLRTVEGEVTGKAAKKEARRAAKRNKSAKAEGTTVDQSDQATTNGPADSAHKSDSSDNSDPTATK